MKVPQMWVLCWGELLGHTRGLGLATRLVDPPKKPVRSEPIDKTGD